MNVPLLSVVIPTHKRPQYLPRAIDSALQAAPSDEVEVIVVPNGADDSWQTVAADYAGDARVQWHPHAIGNANVARNHGKARARGKYLRFLDDDDALLPPGARKQLESIERANAELCSGEVDCVDETSGAHYPFAYTDTTDLFVAMALHNRLCLPVAHLFLREALRGFDWNERLRSEQDTDWMLALAAKRDWRWLPIDDVVGEWHWHAAQRTSASIDDAIRERFTAQLLRRSAHELQARDALDAARGAAIADTIWRYAHPHFHQRPLFWSRLCNFAHGIAPDSRPPDAFFAKPVLRRLHPVLLEWLLVPKRRLNDLLRSH